MHPETRFTVKNQLKNLALELRNCKKTLRENMVNKSYEAREQWAILARKREFRHMHLAYCCARGRTVAQIESKVSKDNPLDKNLLAEYQSVIAKLDQENHVKFPRPVRASLLGARDTVR